jgi:hypothetical protein
MAVLYSLYDALVSINVPNDKARSVVDAMEMDMLGKLATKVDLANTRELLSKEIGSTRELLSKEIESRCGLLSKDIEAAELRMDKKLTDLADKLTLRLAGLTAAIVGAATALIGAVRYFS